MSETFKPAVNHPPNKGKIGRIERLIDDVEGEIREIDNWNLVTKDNIRKTFEGLYYNLWALNAFRLAMIASKDKGETDAKN